MINAQLVPHPSTPCVAVRSIRVELGAGWRVRYHIEGLIADLVLPGPGAAARSDDLWKHTCCELFVANPVDGSYVELNFSPSGAWAAYRFDSYRAGMRELPLATPRIDSHVAAATLVLEVMLTGQEPGLAAGARTSPCCVIEERGGRLSYWALAHPSARADFHHADGFLLELEPAA